MGFALLSGCPARVQVRVGVSLPAELGGKKCHRHNQGNVQAVFLAQRFQIGTRRLTLDSTQRLASWSIWLTAVAEFRGR